MHTPAGGTLRNTVTLTFDRLISGPVRVEILQRSARVPSSVLIARVVLLLERKHTYTESQMPLM